MCSDCSLPEECPSESKEHRLWQVFLFGFSVFFRLAQTILKITLYLSLKVKKERKKQKNPTLNQRMSGTGLPSTTTAKRGLSPAQTSRSSMIVSNVGAAGGRHGIGGLWG